MEKEELLEKFYQIAPILKSFDNFGWIPLETEGGYRIIRDFENAAKDMSQWFTDIHVNVITGVHSSYTYFDMERGMVRVIEASI